MKSFIGFTLVIEVVRCDLDGNIAIELLARTGGLAGHYCRESNVSEFGTLEIFSMIIKRYGD